MPPPDVPLTTTDTAARATSLSKDTDVTLASMASMLRPMVAARSFRESSTPCFTASAFWIFLAHPASRTAAIKMSLFTNRLYRGKQGGLRIGGKKPRSHNTRLYGQLGRVPRLDRTDRSKSSSKAFKTLRTSRYRCCITSDEATPLSLGAGLYIAECSTSQKRPVSIDTIWYSPLTLSLASGR